MKNMMNENSWTWDPETETMVHQPLYVFRWADSELNQEAHEWLHDNKFSVGGTKEGWKASTPDKNLALQFKLIFGGK